MLTTVAICSSALTLSRGETVISVLWVTNELPSRDCTSFPWCIGDSRIELHVDSVACDFPVQPEKIDSGTGRIISKFADIAISALTYLLKYSIDQHPSGTIHQ